jgi:hypothetical protein
MDKGEKEQGNQATKSKRINIVIAINITAMDL